MRVKSYPTKVRSADPKPWSFLTKTKITTGTMNFNNMRTASKATLSPGSRRSRPKKLYIRFVKKKKKKKKKTRGEGQVYKRRDLLLDLGGGESGERFEDELGLEDALAGQTAARCGPWQLAHF